MPRTLTRDTRLDFRLAQEDKSLIEQAASLVGLTVSQFVASNSLEAAQRIVRDRQGIVMSQRDFDAFVAALDSDEPACERAMRGASAYNAWRRGGAAAPPDQVGAG